MIGLLVWMLVFAGTAYADETVTVDYASILGPVTYKASGFLHGLSDTTAAPPDSYTTAVKARNVRTTASFVSVNYVHLNGLGVTRQQSVLSDNFPTPYPGDDGTYTAWNTFVTNQFNSDQAAGATDVTYGAWNEPDSSWHGVGGIQQYFQMWKNTVTTLRALKPSVKTEGPTITEYNNGTSWIHPFLDFCKANNVCPTYLTWHELTTPGGLLGVAANVTDANNYMDAIAISPRIPIVINEYGPEQSFLWPGMIAKFLAAFERESTIAFATRSCWSAIFGYFEDNCGNKSLNGLLIPGGTLQTRAMWYVYTAYAAMAGNMVTITPSADPATPSQPLSGVDGSASVTTGQSVVLLGRNNFAGTGENVTVRLTNLGSAPGFSGFSQVHVTAYYIANWQQFATPYQPPALPPLGIDANYVVLNGTATVVLPTFGGLDAYQLVVTPTSGGGGTTPLAPASLNVS